MWQCSFSVNDETLRCFMLSLFAIGKMSGFGKLLHAPSMANFERTMRSVSGVQRCRLSNLQACRGGILLVVAATFCLNAGVVEGAPAGSCGDLNAGFTCDPGNCCSKENYCGSDSAHCGEGCQLQFSPIGMCQGDTRNGPASAPGSTTPKCGRHAGNRKCDDNMCCSRFGQCGTTGDFCYATKGCQSQCRLTPGQIAGIVVGAMVGFAILCAITFGMFLLYGAHQRKKAINRDSITPVHRLFPVAAAEDKDTCVDIVLCHGFAIGDLEREVWKNTWHTTSRSENEPVVCWPEVWLERDIPEGKARVFALEYDANISFDPQRKGYHTDVSEIAKNLLHSLFGPRYKIGQSNAVVLIGHSFGGLVIKSLVLEAQSQAHQKAKNAWDRAHAASCQKFVDNIRGFIFYAVPHSGGQNLEVYIKTLLRWYNRRLFTHESHYPQGTLLSNIKDLSRKMEELSELFQAFLDKGVDDHLPVFAFIEGLPMSEAVGKIVEDASAIRLSNRNYYKVETANHFTVCRPSTRDDESYQKLLSVLNPIIVDASHSSHRTTKQFDVEMYHGSEHSGSQSLLHPAENPASSRKLTRLTRSKPGDDTLPL